MPIILPVARFEQITNAAVSSTWARRVLTPRPWLCDFPHRATRLCSR